MKSEFAIFNVAISQYQSETTELNKFLHLNRTIQTRQELIVRPEGPCWSFLIEYLPGLKSDDGPAGAKSGIDYREILSAEDFSLFIKLKEVRREFAETAGLPVYAVFTNEQLAEIARIRPSDLAGLQAIKGVGEARAKNYGQAVITCLAEGTVNGETGRTAH